MGFGVVEILVIFFVLFGSIPSILALFDILRSEFVGNNKLLWLLVVLVFPLFGALLYFVLGRKQKVP